MHNKRRAMVPAQDSRRTQSELDMHHKPEDPFEVGEFYTAVGADGMIIFYLKLLLLTKPLIFRQVNNVI